MKYKNLIKLLSVLLCMVMLLTACNNGKTEETTSEQMTQTETESVSETATETETETERPDDVYVEVAPKIENFIKFEYEIDWQELSEVKRIDDVVYTTDGNFVIVRDATLDNEGVVTESFKVLNTATSEIILEKSHKYAYKTYYDSFDWYSVDPQSDYAPSVMSVEILGFTYVSIIHVAHAEFTVTEEETLCDGTLERTYESSFTHEFYDMSGTELAVTDTIEKGFSFEDQASTSKYACFRSGIKKIFIDKDTNKLVSIIDENGSIMDGFDYENDRYGYYFDNYSNTGIFGDSYYFEVYRKFTGELKRYYLSNDWDNNEYIGVLKNGDVVVQLRCKLPDENGVQYDVMIGYDKYDIKTFIYDVSEGECREIELNYMIETVFDQETFYELLHMENTGVSFTENAWNVAVASPIKEKNVETTRVVIFNDAMDVIFELDPIAPDHYISAYEERYSDYWSLGMKVLKNGDILINVATSEVTDANGGYIYYAIVTPEGKVRCYLVSDHKIAGTCIVSDKYIYDFDMNPIYNLEEEELTLRGIIGEKIIVSKTVAEWQWVDGETFEKVYKTEYYALYVSEGTVQKDSIFKDEQLAVDYYGSRYITEDYVITCSDDFYNGARKFTLYNANLEKLLTTHGTMNVVAMEEGYLVTSYINGTGIVYTVK